ncbi:MAG: AAC(3) family N-acetyltransferase [Clostridia bacterium]|nr:AAC(3) family N-acetyltransferase [Clostridia bacterium]
MVTKKDIFSFLQSIGVTRNDTVLIHTSMRSTGGVENGCDGLIDAFCEYLKEGLFIVPSHTWASVNKDNPSFDVRTSIPCIGALPCVAINRPDGVRSLHPTHSVVAFGKRAKEYISGEEKLHTPAPENGVWGRLYEENAKILLIGVGHNRNTYLHVVDEILDIKGRLEDEPFEAVITDYDGMVYKTEMFKHKGTYSEFFPNFKPALEQTGAVKYAKLGDALVYCCDAKKCRDTVLYLWENANHDIGASCEEIHIDKNKLT